MTRKERVLSAIRHVRPDRTPRGDLAIENGLMRALIGEEAYGDLEPRERLLRAWDELDSDLIDVHQFPMDQVGQTEKGEPIFRSVLGDEHVITSRSSHLHRPALADMAEVEQYTTPSRDTIRTDDLDWYLGHTDRFVFAQVMGPVSSLDWILGTEDYLVWCMEETDAVRLLADKVMQYEEMRALTFIEHGADAILVADDMAFNSGLFLPPAIMEVVAWPFYRRILERIKAKSDVPVFLHTDGDIRAALPLIADCGFDGLHSLQPSAGMDIDAVKRDYGDRLCLMGNMDLDRLMTFGTPEEVEVEARRLCREIGRDGGFILSTCNILIDAVSPVNARAMYRAAE